MAAARQEPKRMQADRRRLSFTAFGRRLSLRLER